MISIGWSGLEAIHKQGQAVLLFIVSIFSWVHVIIVHSFTPQVLYSAITAKIILKQEIVLC